MASVWWCWVRVRVCFVLALGELLDVLGVVDGGQGQVEGADGGSGVAGASGVVQRRPSPFAAAATSAGVDDVSGHGMHCGGAHLRLK